MASPLFYLLLLVQVCCPINAAKRLDATRSPRFTAILIFGDSLLDTGNNNFIPTVLKANHKPYGQDFPGKIPTGRFSNGKLVSDLLASALGIKDTVPPFLDPKLPREELRTGVCFASAGSGYDDMTTVTSELYSQGCRNMLIAGLPPLGCWAAGFNMGGRCVDYSQSQSYNQKLVAMLSQLQESLPGSKLVYADFYTPLYDMMNNPQKYGKDILVFRRTYFNFDIAIYLCADTFFRRRNS
ncbi:hypothetical protein RHMOL_Rhmol11G0175700 [Rhododendron molle]|uniref:Uncharacterized protein n=1 Tax=Rhododendron molle TaxID=49168 RepID=A0ACC0LTX7_RHOML|nr:hypothetical protein RHMOL_Rhmol11G0175700 [Rhododendron molle]